LNQKGKKKKKKGGGKIEPASLTRKEFFAKQRIIFLLYPDSFMHVFLTEDANL